jgi:hypothetical protein
MGAVIDHLLIGLASRPAIFYGVASRPASGNIFTAHLPERPNGTLSRRQVRRDGQTCYQRVRFTMAQAQPVQSQSGSCRLCPLIDFVLDAINHRHKRAANSGLVTFGSGGIG